VTGMSDAMRSDFRVMNDVGAFTRLVPQTREEVSHFDFRLLECKVFLDFRSNKLSLNKTKHSNIIF